MAGAFRLLPAVLAAALLSPASAFAGRQPPTFGQWLGACIPIVLFAVVVGLVAWQLFRLKGMRSRSLTVACFIPGFNYLTLLYAIGAPDMIARRRLEEIAAKCGMKPAQDEAGASGRRQGSSSSGRQEKSMPKSES